MAAPPISERHLPHFHRRVPVVESVRVATTGNITISTGLNVGDTIDGVTLADKDRVLVKSQSTGSQNGIYVAGATPARDYDESTDDPNFGYLVRVREGTANAGTLWANTNTSAPTIGTTALTFSQFTSGGGGGSDFYDVQDYGAVGDGSTDDTTAISNTFDAADATNGGIIYFPPTANYYKTTTLISRTGTSVYHVLGGGGRYGPARVHQATSNTGVFKFAPGSGTANRTKAPLVESLVISGAGGASSGIGIEFQNDGHVRDCFIYGFFVGAKWNSASYYSFIKDSTVTDCDSIGIHASSCNNFTVDTCRVTGLFSGGSAPIGTLQHGIVFTSPSPYGLASRIVNSGIEYFTGDGITIDGGQAVEIIGNYLESQQSSTGHAHLKVGATNLTDSIRIESNYFQGDGTGGFDAIAFDHAQGIAIRGNYFGHNNAIGISSTANTSNVLLDSNTNFPAGTFSLPATTYTLDPAAPPLSNPMTTTGDIIYSSSGTTAARKAIGSTGQALVVAAGVPAWATAAGDVSGQYTALSVDKVKGVTISGTPAAGDLLTATSSSAATWSAPAPVTAGQLVIASGHSTPLVFADIVQNSDGDDFIYGT